MKARLLAVDDPAWSTFLGSTGHDFFHLPEYVTLAARGNRGKPKALLVEDGARAMLLPIVLLLPVDVHAANPVGKLPGQVAAELRVFGD